MPANEAGSCDDGLFCTTVDVCVAGECVGNTPMDCGDSGDVCTQNVCNEDADSCETVAATEGGTCDDGLFCTTGDVCVAGTCAGPTPMDCGATGEFCTQNVCNEATDSCDEVPANENAACLSDDLCEVAAVCVAGVCAGEPMDCSGSDTACGSGVCNPLNGQCELDLVPAGTACGGNACSGSTCNAAGACIPGAPLPDGASCNASARCATDGICIAGGCYESAECTVVYEDTFEGDTTSWTLAGDWEIGAPTSGPNATTSGLQLLATNVDGTYSNSRAYGSAAADTPVLDLTGLNQPLLSFWAWTHTENVDGMNVKVSADGGTTFEAVTNVSPAYDRTVDSQPAWGGNGSSGLIGWRFHTVDLSDYTNEQIVVRFDFRSDGSVVYPGFYIDDVRLQEAGAVPLEITTDAFPALFANTPISATIQRVGGSAGAVWSIVGGTNHTWLGIDPATGALSGVPTTGSGTVTFRVVEPSLPWNFDEATFSFVVKPAPLASEGFETACAGWSVTGIWECGEPTTGPNAALAGVGVLATDLDASYPNSQAWGANTATSPAFDLSSASSAWLSFASWVGTESCCDGFNVKVSTDGTTFVPVTNPRPAYNTTISTQPAWTGTSGWRTHYVDLSAYLGQPQLFVRFDFRSDGSSTGPGIYIDNLYILDGGAVPVAITRTSLGEPIVGHAYAERMGRTGGSATVQWSIVGGTNHEWLSIDPATGLLTGTPTAAGEISVTVRVVDGLDPTNTAEATLSGTVWPQATMRETFETGCSSWTFTGDWACGVPQSGPLAAFGGDNLIATNLNGNYADGQNFGTAYAESPTYVIPPGSEPFLSFWTWMRTDSSADGFNLKVSNDGGATWTQVTGVSPAYNGSISSQQSWYGDRQSWARYTADLTQYSGQSIKLRFDFRSTASTNYAGVYIDNLSLYEANQNPLAITGSTPAVTLIGQPYSFAPGRTGGASTAQWSIVDGTGHSWLSIDPATGVLSGTPTVAGQVTVTIRVQEPSVPANQAELTLSFKVASTVWSDDFETCGTWVLSTDWGCGAPTSGPNAASAGTGVLATNLAGNYTTGMRYASATADSPPISLVGTNAPVLSFKGWYRSESNYDGFKLQVSTDAGASFADVTGVTPAYGNIGGTCCSAETGPAWNGTGTSWQNFSLDLSPYAGQTIILRFAFTSDTSGTEHPGAYIDEMLIVD